MEIISSLNIIVRYIGLFIEYIGLFIVAASAIVAMVRIPMKEYSVAHIRGHLARRIIFGLEFVIAADVLLATVAVNLDQIYQLGGIVLIRIMLGYALRKEVEIEK